MASVSSLDKDLRKMRLDKYTPQAANEVRDWIESVLGEPLESGDLLDALKNGVALCKLVNLVLPPPGVKYKPSAMPFVQMENISHFLRACQSPPLNLQPHDVFLTVDLFEQKDPAQVLQCLAAFSRVANRVMPSKFPTAIGPKPRPGMMSPQGTGTGAVGGGSYGNRVRGASITSNQSSAYNTHTRTGSTPTKEVGSGRWNQTKTDKPVVSPGGGTSSWSKKQDEGVTAPAWNIAQYGYMGGASQGNMGIAFGGRRQITSAGPHVPSMAEKMKKRREQEAEDERLKLQAEEAERNEREAEEKRATMEEAERWAEEERKLKEKSAEEKRKWEEDERRWKHEEEMRQQEEREAEALLEKETRRARVTSDERLQGQFLSQYQAQQGLARRDRSKSPGPSSRVQELERELELAREREREYERERQGRVKTRDHETLENHDFVARIKEEDTRSQSRDRSLSRPRLLPRKPSEESWISDERDYLRKEWTKQHQDEALPPKPPRTPQHSYEAPPSKPPRTPQHTYEAPPPMPPRTPQHQDEAGPAKPPRPLPEPIPAVRAVKNNTGPSSRPLPDPATYRPPPQTAASSQSRTERFLSSNPAPQAAQPHVTYSSELGAFDSSAERDAEERRRVAGQSKTKAGGWASKSLLEREMEMERQRQQEWEEGQKATAQAAMAGGQAEGVDGIGGGIGGRWDVNQWTGYTGGDGQNRGSQGIGAGRRQIVGPRAPPRG